MTVQIPHLRRILVQEVGWGDETAETFLFALDDAFPSLATKDDLRALEVDLTAALAGEAWKAMGTGVGILLVGMAIVTGILLAVLG